MLPLPVLKIYYSLFTRLHCRGIGDFDVLVDTCAWSMLCDANKKNETQKGYLVPASSTTPCAFHSRSSCINARASSPPPAICTLCLARIAINVVRSSPSSLVSHSLRASALRLATSSSLGAGWCSSTGARKDSGIGRIVRSSRPEEDEDATDVDVVISRAHARACAMRAIWTTRRIERRGVEVQCKWCGY